MGERAFFLTQKYKRLVILPPEAPFPHCEGLGEELVECGGVAGGGGRARRAVCEAAVCLGQVGYVPMAADVLVEGGELGG